MKDEDKTKVEPIKELKFLREELQKGVCKDFIEHKPAEEKLKASEEYLQILFDDAPDAYFINDLKGSFIDCNKVAESLFGYKKEELIGKNFLKLKMLSPADIPKEAKLFTEELSELPTGTGELVLSRKDNTKVTVEISAYPVKVKGKTHVLGIVRDITKLKKTKNAIVYEQSLLHDLMDNIPDFIYFKDEKNRFVRVNKASAEDMGVTLEYFIGKTDFDIFTEEAAKKRFADDNWVIKTGKSIINNIEKITYLNGMERWWNATKIPRYDKGKIIGTIGITRDITQRKLAEDGVKNAKDELQTILDLVPAIIFYKDLEDRFIRVNKALADALKMPTTDLIGKRAEELFPKEEAEKMKRDGREVVISGKPKRNIIQPYTTPDGIRWQLVDKVPYISKEGKIIGVIGLAKDITEQRKSEQKFQDTFQKLKKTMDAAINTMSKIVEAKDPYTAGHQWRVSQLATAIAKELHFSEDKVEGIRIASLIHDIGKVGLPSEILSKPDKICNEEYNLIKRHSQVGYDILKGIDFSYPVAEIVLQHHERLNGLGYPNHLKGDKILLEAKIIGVADVVEAMSSHRPYRPALGIDKALEEITQNKGILYDPEAVDVCLKLFKEKGFKFE